MMAQSDINNEVEVVDWEKMPKDPTISVYMITYNHHEYIVEAIESVVTQSINVPFELVIGDDGSQDGTLEAVLKLREKYPEIIRVVYTERNTGWRENSTRVFKRLRGKYVAFCEGDDYWNSREKLLRQYTFLEANPGYALHHSAVLAASKRGLRAFGETPVPSGQVYNDLIIRNFIATCSVFIRHDIIRSFMKSTFSEKKYRMGDYPLWMHASLHGAIGYDSMQLAVYRLTPGSLSRSGVRNAILMEQSRRQVVLDYTKHCGCSATVLETSLKESFRITFGLALGSADRDMLLAEYRWAVDLGIQIHRRSIVSMCYLIALIRLHIPMKYLFYVRSTVFAPIKRCILLN